MKICKAVDLGLIPYSEALVLQRDLVAARKAGTAPDVLLLCEHPHVLTLGRNGKAGHLKASAERLQQMGIELHHINRGGDITYHGPGQLVGYPILHLGEIRRDVVWYVRQLEELLIRAGADFGVNAFRVPGCTGVWVDSSNKAGTAGHASGGSSQRANGGSAVNGAAGEKLAAIGVHISRWVTSHGFACNVSADLRYFDLIVPCGIAGCRVTSLEKLLGRPLERAGLVERIIQHFGAVFSMEMQLAHPRELRQWLSASEGSGESAAEAAGVRKGP